MIFNINDRKKFDVSDAFVCAYLGVARSIRPLI